MKLTAKSFAKFLKGKVGINCKTEESAKVLFGILKPLNVNWEGAELPMQITDNAWDEYEEDTMYVITLDGLTNTDKDFEDFEMIIM